MKERIAKLIVIIGILFFLYLIFMPHIVIEMLHVQSGGKPFYERAIDSIKDSFDKAVNRDKYNKYLNEYIKERFGDVVSEKLKIIYNDSYRYTIKFDDIMDKQFIVYCNTKTGKCSDSFSSVISTDPKFLHLYSEWVKKQVGIDDENVELKFYGQQSNPKLAIEFNKITSLSDDYREIFENTHNFFCSEINVMHLDNLNSNNCFEIANGINNEYLDKVRRLIGSPSFKFDCRIGLSNNEFLADDFNVYYRCDYNSNYELYESLW